jgi:hypothetical protein
MPLPLTSPARRAPSKARIRFLGIAIGILLGAGLAFAPVPSVATVKTMHVDAERPAYTGGAKAGRILARQANESTFRLIGLTWAAGGPVPVQLRTHTAAGWGPWRSFSGEDDDAPDLGSAEARRPQSGTGPLWVGKADGYEVEAPAGTMPAVHLVRDGASRVRVTSASTPARANASPPPISMRSAWGARPPKTTPTIAPSLKMGFVHHTAGSNDYTADEVPSILRGIQAYHMDTNGWDDIGYNFLVDKFGRIWEGREGGIDQAVVGAQAEGFNRGSTGVSVLGEFTSVAPSPDAVGAVSTLLGWKLPLHGVDPSGTNQFTSGGSNKYPAGTVVTLNNVSGHRDAQTTACPGQMLYDKLPQIRTAATLHGAAVTAYPGFNGGVFVATGQLDGDAPTEIVTGADAGGGPHVRTFDPNGVARTGFFAYDAGWRGGVRVAAGQFDLNPTDAIDEILTGVGPGGGPHVKTFRADGTPLSSFFAYDGGFRGGVYVASGNVDGLPGDEIITGAGPGGGPHVRIFTGNGTPLGGFFAYSPNFAGGVRVATADLDGDGIDEIITGAGPGGGPHVRAFKLDGTVVANFFAYDAAFTRGVYVGGVTMASGPNAIVTGAGEGGGPHVRIFSASGVVRSEFFANAVDDYSGVRLAGGNFDGASAGQIATTSGPNGLPVVKLKRQNGSLLIA